MSTQNYWPTNTIEVQGYEGWKAEVYDLTVGEVNALQKAVQSMSLDEIVGALLPSIKSWTFTNRVGEVVPITDDGASQVPMLAIRNLMVGVLEHINADPFQAETNISES